MDDLHPLCTSICMNKNSVDTYWERVWKFQQRLNPLLLLPSSADIQEAERIAGLAEKGNWEELQSEGVTPKNLQKLVLLRDASINASNGETIPRLFRLAAFAPVNIPICAGMLLSSPTFGNSIFWQWINQTYNAAFNYANGNHPKELTQKQEQESGLIKAYSAAVGVSVGIAVGLNMWLRKANASGHTLKILQSFIPYTAVSGANVANVFCMRGGECIHGIPVLTECGQPLGVSKRAGLEAVIQTAISRVVLPLPALLLPRPLISLFNMALPVTRTNAFVKVLTEISVIFGCLSVGIPMAVGIFPEMVRIPVSKLESEFQTHTDDGGNPITYVLFNRGM